MATFNLTNDYQNLSLNIPDDGEAFKMDNDYYVRSGNNVYKLNPEVIGDQFAQKQGVETHSAAEKMDYFNQYIQQQGIDLSNIQQNSYNLGDINTALSQMGGTVQMAQLNDISKFTQALNQPVQTGEVITATTSPDNPHGLDVTSSTQGTLATSPSLAENLAAVGATPEQISALTQAMQGGQPVTNELLQSIGVTTSLDNVNNIIQASTGGATGDTLGGATGGTMAGTGGVLGTTTAGGGTTGGQTDPATAEELNNYLAQSGLPQDLQDMVRSSFQAVSTNDTETFNRLMAAFETATEFSDPYFKAQIAIATDALKRGIEAQEGDLSFKETSIQNTLKDLQANLGASKDYLSFQHQQELQQLQQRYEQDLEVTRDDMASKGFTSSSIRARKENLLEDNLANMTESSKRGFEFETGRMDRQQASAERDTARQSDYYQTQFQQNLTNTLREGEQALGSTTLGNLGYTGLLGNIGGKIPEAQVESAIKFANDLVF